MRSSMSKLVGNSSRRSSTAGLFAVVETANEAAPPRSSRKADAALGIGDDLRASLASFAVGAGVYDILFRGAGPDPSGTLAVDRVAENASFVAREDDPEIAS